MSEIGDSYTRLGSGNRAPIVGAIDHDLDRILQKPCPGRQRRRRHSFPSLIAAKNHLYMPPFLRHPVGSWPRAKTEESLAAVRVRKEGLISWRSIVHDFARISKKPWSVRQRRRRPSFLALIGDKGPLFLTPQAPQELLEPKGPRDSPRPHAPQGPQELKDPKEEQELKYLGVRTGQRTRRATWGY